MARRKNWRLRRVYGRRPCAICSHATRRGSLFCRRHGRHFSAYVACSCAEGTAREAQVQA